MDPVDVLIIAALKEELEAVQAVAGATWTPYEDDHPYLQCDVPCGDGRRLSIALARPTRMGGRVTSQFATHLAGKLNPDCLAMSGVCAGNPSDVALGDVVVAEVTYEYDEGKLTEQGLVGDHRQYRLDDHWFRAAQELDPARLPSYGQATDEEAALWFLERLHAGQDPKNHPARNRYFPSGTWNPRLAGLESHGLIAWGDSGWQLTVAGRSHIMRLLYNDVDGPDKLPFAVVAGPMASGNYVAKDGESWDRLKAMGVRTVVGLEMEAATIATVAEGQNIPHWLVVKGVMDHADPNKDDRYKRFAARAAAEVLFALLDQHAGHTPPATEPRSGRQRREALRHEPPHGKQEEKSTVESSQSDWIAVRETLKSRRVSLARTLARSYYAADRVFDSGLIGLPEWRPKQPINLSDVQIEYQRITPTPEITGREHQSLHTRPRATTTEWFTRYSFAMRELTPSKHLSNRPSWRVLAIKGPNHVVFGDANYFEALDVSEALAHEAALLLPAAISPNERIAVNLPFRNYVNPAIGLHRRPVIPAISTLLIRNDPKKPTTILHQRSPDNATAGGTVQVIPSGTFQPSYRERNPPGLDFSLWRNIMREYDEELLGNPERDGESSEPIDYSHQSPYRDLDAALAAGGIKLFYLGFALDALTLWGEFMTVAVFEPDVFDGLTPQFRELGEYYIQQNYEGPKIEVVPFSKKVLNEILRKNMVQPAGEYCIRTAIAYRDMLLG